MALMGKGGPAMMFNNHVISGRNGSLHSSFMYIKHTNKINQEKSPT